MVRYTANVRGGAVEYVEPRLVRSGSPELTCRGRCGGPRGGHRRDLWCSTRFRLSSLNFGNFGAPSFAAVTGVKPEATFSDMPLGGVLGTAGSQAFSAETVVIGTVVASATNFVTATAFLEVDYLVP